MINEVKFSTEFCKAFKKLKKRYRSFPDDFKSLFKSLISNPLQGKALYDGMRKIRISFSSKGKGKSGGGRVIIHLTLSNSCLSFLYVYDKSDMENVSDKFLDQIIFDIDNGNYNNGLTS